ncbi:hypothetical protein CLV28_2565 [Sediminihabitans luteus]|uniref:DUF8094 domain-containing protein n=1 Tax=Sediminihabitans luteus TaxID=1138585 RepID=A0A2M9CDX6_9CELL|nr:hypothetical protein [Sediminihabitans luteus]PJJ70087.1 hypothetical protein CLV28_2565 [Sediminihabitans luteus]GIJ00129.1 hypothetical protein Slu03_25060 [Sediminihabitans luteus]
MTTRATARRGAAAAAATLTLGLLLGGCAADLPTPDPDAVPAVPGPDLTVEQTVAVSTEVGAVLDAADEAMDSRGLDERVTGPALTMRSAQLKAAVRAKNDELLTVLPDEMQQNVVSTTVTWPRTSLGVTVEAGDGELPRLLAYEQASARSPYKLWSWVRLFPGVELPPFAEPSVGSAAVPLDSDELLLSPQDAFSQYVDVLNLGKDSEFAKSWADDRFRQDRAEQKAKATKALDDVEGTWTEKFSPVDDDIRAIATTDGGALVIGAMTGQETWKAPEGAKITPQTDTEKALLAKDPTNSLKLSGLATVAIYVPPAGADAKPTVLGAQLVLTKVTN